MKYVKMLGLAAIAAAALMAFVGSSTASATILCKVTPETKGSVATCPEGQAYPGGTTIHAVNVGTVFLHSSFKTVECKKSTVQGNTAGEENISGAVAVLTFEECNCEVKVLLNGTQSATRVAGTHNGTLSANGQEVTVTCSTIFGNVHCIYVTNEKDLAELPARAPTIHHAAATVAR